MTRKMTRNTTRNLSPDMTPTMTGKKRKTAARRARDQRRLQKNDPRIAAHSPDEPPRDIDALRLMLARRINMFVGKKRRWRTCKEPACRRARACVAPDIECSNAPPPRPDPDGRHLKRAQAALHRMVREHAAQIEAQIEAEKK
jgi:hypothetical protein